jgi:hypothetical protein
MKSFKLVFLLIRRASVAFTNAGTVGLSASRHSSRSYLKNVFWPPAFFGGIGAAFQILDTQQYASGLKLGPAAILNQNPIFEIASRINDTHSGISFYVMF